MIVPDRALATAKARQALPAQVSREDAAFNLGRMGLLLAGPGRPPAAVEGGSRGPPPPGLPQPAVPRGADAAGRPGAGGRSGRVLVRGRPQPARDLHRCRRRRGPCRWPRAAWSRPASRGRCWCCGADTAGLVTGDAARLPGLSADGDQSGAAGPDTGRRRASAAPGRARTRSAPTYTSAMARKFVIRTFGCQMNEHDSERLAGLLVADGIEPTEDLADADVVVLNTCCIRENADNKLYGHLGQLKSLREPSPACRSPWAVAWPRRTGSWSADEAGHVDVVFGTHNLARAPALLRRAAAEGPMVEILDAPDPDGRRPADHAPALSAVRELPYAAWVTIQTGCDNSCAFCIVPSVRGREVSRPLGRHRRRGGGPGPPRAWWRSPCSARTSTPTAAT